MTKQQQHPCFKKTVFSDFPLLFLTTVLLVFHPTSLRQVVGKSSERIYIYINLLLKVGNFIELGVMYLYDLICPPWWTPGVMIRKCLTSNVCACSVSQSCLTLCDPMNCSPPGSSVHGISQARILEWVAISFSGGSSRSGDRTCISWVSCIGGQILYHWATGEALWHKISTNKYYASVTTHVITIIQRPKSSWLPQFTDEKTEAQNSSEGCTEPHSCE